MVSEFERQLRRYGIENLEDFLRQTGQTVEQYREGLREQAETIARRNLVISELYRKEGIDVTDEEIEERINAMIGPQRARTEAGDAGSADAETQEVEGQETETVEAEGEVMAGMAAEGEGPTGQEAPDAGAAEAEVGENAVDEDEVDEGEVDEDEVDEDEAAENDAAHALREMMRSGSGRAVLESQLLQEKALDRLLMIVRGEELPELPPAEVVKEAEPLPTEAGATEPPAGESTEGVAPDNQARLESENQGEAAG